MKPKSCYLMTLFLFSLFLLFSAGVRAQHDHPHPHESPHQLPDGQYSNVPHAPEPSSTDYITNYDIHPYVPPYPFDSTMDTKIIGEVKRVDGESEAVFHLRSQPMPEKERRLSNGSRFLLLNDYLTSKRTFTKLLVKVLTNPPSNQFVGDTGWVEISHTSLYQYYNPETNGIDTNMVYKKYLSAAAKFREQSTNTTCTKNKKCLAGYAKYYDCMAKSEKEHTPTASCKMNNCIIEDCPGDAPKN